MAATIEEVDLFLAQVYAAKGTKVSGHRTASIDLIYNTLDGWVFAGDWQALQWACEQVDVTRVSISQALSFLTNGKQPHKDGKIAAYPGLYARLEAHLDQINPSRTVALLQGLAPTAPGLSLLSKILIGYPVE